MKQEDKELILKDVCARLPYGIKGAIQAGDIISLDKVTDYSPLMSFKNAIYKHGWRPYLFPLLNMSEDLKNELYTNLTELELKALNDEIEHNAVTAFEIDFYHKHHIDYRGLINKDLAIDATELDIY